MWEPACCAPFSRPCLTLPTPAFPGRRVAMGAFKLKQALEGHTKADSSLRFSPKDGSNPKTRHHQTRGRARDGRGAAGAARRRQQVPRVLAARGGWRGGAPCAWERTDTALRGLLRRRVACYGRLIY